MHSYVLVDWFCARKVDLHEVCVAYAIESTPPETSRQSTWKDGGPPTWKTWGHLPNKPNLFDRTLRFREDMDIKWKECNITFTSWVAEFNDFFGVFSSERDFPLQGKTWEMVAMDSKAMANGEDVWIKFLEGRLRGRVIITKNRHGGFFDRPNRDLTMTKGDFTTTKGGPKMPD